VAQVGEEEGRGSVGEGTARDAAARSGGERRAGGALVFIGFMGAGKSTTATDVAKALGVQALDSDRLLEERMGHSIPEEFERGGEEAFRAKEEELVCGLLAGAGPDSVIALGGGSVLYERVRKALAEHLTVLLDVDAEVAWDRTMIAGKQAGRARPLARNWDAFASLHAERRALYEELADAILPAGHQPSRGAGELMLTVRALPALRTLAAAPRGTRLLWASAESGEYPVLIGSHLLTDGGWSDAVWPLDRSASRSFCVSDETVAALHAPPSDCLQALVTIPPGERHKTLASAEAVWRALAEGEMTRADHLVALGGGVVGDLAGFCAATYQRGVPVVQVPTTLVAQVDSAYGGKTGVDLPQAKNYIGAYHQPAAVMVDPDMLQTLPRAELEAGWVEVLKTALIAGGELWEQVSDDKPVDERTIFACARTKLAVVAADERDGGRRQVLNLGHTVGHAIETATGYARYRHGEAVGLGLLAALRLSGREELREQVRELLQAHGLPVQLQGADVQQVVRMTRRDKKRTGESVPFVLIDAPGKVEIGCEVASDALRAAVAELVR
jgi:shikimate kinase / 3-dehydroquinate synthase